jgi:hypothetical protein
MPELLERPISSLPEFCQATYELGMASARRRLWFRGVNNVDYPLVPRLYRSDSEVADLLALEGEMLAEFRSRSRPLLTSEMASDWEHLFVMQHYGVPTRLLDWSENALFALYFALSAAEQKGYPTDAAVWILDPAVWNREVVPGMKSPGNPVCVGDAVLGDYEPGRSLQAVFEEGDFPATTLRRLRLPREALGELNEQLRLLGFRESMIYPDLGGLATEIRVEQGLA